jgi:aspartate 1-decarboxylase
MLRTVCKSKLHRATVTDANIEYPGSLTLDADLMRAADILPYEQVHVVDVDNGARLVTYCIEGAAGSGTVCMNGAAARLVSVGHRVILITYAQLSEEELERAQPKIVLLDARNRVRELTPGAYHLSGTLGLDSSVSSPRR